LSLIEIHCSGVEKWRFAEVDISSAYSDFGGLFNAPNYPNGNAFATLKADGSITAWGDSEDGGADTPDGNGSTKIFSNGPTSS
jgi:hypothetical protein